MKTTATAPFVALASSLLWTTCCAQGQGDQQQQHPHRQRHHQRHRQRLRGATEAAAKRDLGLFDEITTEHVSSKRMNNVGHLDADRNIGYSDNVGDGSLESGGGGASPASFPTSSPSENGTDVEVASNNDNDSDTSSGGSICKSIIAIGNYRLPPSDPNYGRYYDANGFKLRSKDRQLFDVDENEEDFGPDETFVCELYNGEGVVPIVSTQEQLGELRRALNDGVLVSAVSTVGVTEEEVSSGSAVDVDVNVADKVDTDDDGTDDDDDAPQISFMTPEEEGGGASSIMAMAPPLSSVTLPPGAIQIKTDPHRRLEHEERRAATYTGKKPVLIVRVTDVNGMAVPQTAEQISDKFFGTRGDLENMKSQFGSCSFGELDIAYNDYGDTTDAIVSKLSAPGVLEVSIGISLNNQQGTITNAIGRAVETKLGKSNLPNPKFGNYLGLPGPFAHVLYVVENCYQECGWAAYAYVNSWLSVYQNKYHYMPAVQMHELGHNLNLAHSGGLDGRTYTDHTCLMGNPLFSDYAGDMCFNPAKNYQIVTTGENSPSNGFGNWYGNDRIATWDSEVGRVWKGRLVGIAEFDKMNNGSADHYESKVVLKIESGSSKDLFVGLNRAVGINSDNKEAHDMVTVVEMGGNGRSYSQSFLKAKLGSNNEYTVRNFRHQSDLVITVKEIKTNTVPGYADVWVRLGEETTSPTPAPTPSPTTKPTVSPTKSPTNDPTPLPTTSPTSGPSKAPLAPTTSPTSPPTSSPTIKDDDSSEKDGSTTVEFATSLYDPNRVANGTMFTVEAIHADISIKSLSSYTAIVETNRRVEVYYRPGNYTGYTGDDAGWTRVYLSDSVDLKGLNEMTHIGPFSQDVDISAGETAAFYVYTTSKLSYQYHESWKGKEGRPVLDDGNLKLYAGIALAYGKWTQGCGDVSPQPDGECIFRPRVFSGVFEYSISSALDRSTDGPTSSTAATTTTVSTTTTTTTTTSTRGKPVTKEFQALTRQDAVNSGKGLMFTVKAKRDVTIEGLNIFPKKAYSDILIYVLDGDYEGKQLKADKWDRVFKKSFTGLQPGKLLKLDDFSSTVKIKAGETKSMFVWSRRGMLYEKTGNEREPFGSNDAIVLRTGRVMKSQFRRPTDPGNWAGVMRYHED